MPTDKWGFPHLYPSKPDGFSWEQKDDITEDVHYESEEVSDSGGGEFTINFDGPTSGVIYTDRNFEDTNSIGDCDMNFAETSKRGYIFKSDDPRDVEIKFVMGDVDIGDHGFSISGPTGKHSGSGCCSGFAYMLTLETNTDPIEFRFRKEMWHVSYHTDPKTGTWTHPDFNFRLRGHDKNIGIAYLRFNLKDGVDTDQDAVVLEAWGNPDPDDDPTNWKLLKRTVDTGGWGDDGDECDGEDDHIGVWGGPKFRMKSNGEGSITFKHLSLREIDPLAEFDDIPDNPGTTPPVDQPAQSSTVKGIFKLQRDVNIQRTNPCSGSGFKKIYDVTLLEINDQKDFTVANNTTRVTEQITSSSSSMFQKIPIQLDVFLKKVGTITGSVSAKIWDASGTVKYTSPTTLGDADLTTSYVSKTFSFSTNTYQMQVGDRIGIERTTLSDTDYVIHGYATPNVRVHSQYAQFSTGIWVLKSGRDFGGTIWEA